MASNNQLIMPMDQQQWQFRGDAWLTDIYAKETETLAKAFHKTYSALPNDDVFASDLVDSLFAQPEMVHTPTISGASENEVPLYPTKQRKSSGGGVSATGRIAKRKSRASKRATTTFITADPANFRQMVQQVTGVRFGGDVMMQQHQQQQQILRPEAQRSIGGGGGFDSSSFLLNSAPYLVNGGGGDGSQVNTGVSDGGAAAAGFGYDGFCSFPTLESWKV